MTTITEESSSRTIKVEGVDVRYHDAGEGPALVLIHGGGPGAGGWSNYNRNIEELSKRFRVLAPDLPGFGQSGMKPLKSPMPAWYAEIMGKFLDELGIEKAHFVGNSLGGWISARLALDRPEKVDKLILMGTGGSTPMFSQFPTPGIVTLLTFYDGPGPSLERLKGFIDEFVYDPSEITDELLKQRMKVAMRPEILENPPMRMVPGTKVESLWQDQRLASMPHETLIIWGREDRVMPVDMAFPLLKTIPKARLFVLPRCGHWAQWEHAEEFNKAVVSFIEVS